MFGVSEQMAKALMKERLAAAECRGEQREWCRNEFRVAVRHG